MSYCDTCVHCDVCGVEGANDEAIVYCADRMEPCKEAVSRQAVKEQMIKYGFHAPDMTVTEFVEDLPPANPQPKTGQWIPLSDDTIKNGVDVLLKTTDGDIYKTHLSITGSLPDGGEEELKNIEAFMIIK